MTRPSSGSSPTVPAHSSLSRSSTSTCCGCHEALLGNAVADVGRSCRASGRVAITLHGLVGDSGMALPSLLPQPDRRVTGATGRLAGRLSIGLSESRGPSRSAPADDQHRTVLHDHVLRLRQSLAAAAVFSGPAQFRRDLRTRAAKVHGWQSHRIPAVGPAASHRPLQRVFEPDEIWTDAGSVRMADVVIACVFAHQAGSAPLTDATRLVQLGKHLQIGSDR